MNTYKREYDQDMLYDLFINQNMSAQKIADKYNVPRYIIEGDLKKYNIHKPKNLSYVLREKNIDKDKLYQYYIIENHSTKETAKYFNVHERTIRRRLTEYNIIKSVDKQVECAQRRQIEIYGDLFARSEYYKNSSKHSRKR